VVVAGLNSTMAESHRDQDHYGWVGEAQLRWFAERLRDYEGRGWLRVGVLHHNVVRGAVADDENLRDAADLERILAPRLNLLLHGHTHDAKRHRLGDLLVLSTGSAAVVADARPPDVPNQYQIIRIRADRVERWGRSYSVSEKRWIGDNRLSDDGNDWYEGREERLRGVRALFDEPARREGPTGVPVLPETLEELLERPPIRRSRGDDFPTRVAEVCALRNPDASIRKRITRTTPPLAYLRVVAPEGGTTRQYPIGAYERGVTADDLAQFVEHVHGTFRTADPQVISKLVYGGDPADEQLVQKAWRQGVDLLSFIEYQGILDLRSYVAKQTARLRTDRIYPRRSTFLSGSGSWTRAMAQRTICWSRPWSGSTHPRATSSWYWATLAGARPSCSTSWPGASPRSIPT
jgi:hypothetical protein